MRDLRAYQQDAQTILDALLRTLRLHGQDANGIVEALGLNNTYP